MYCREKDGLWGEKDVMKYAEEYTALEFWKAHRALGCELAKVALRVLGATSTSCAAERNWSDYDFIHSKRRNRLTSARCCIVFRNAMSNVFCSMNLA